ncbi:hypothetical protein [Lysinibacillus sp. 54212]|uniref:hypothetical protein n=1 Tax=Lysinibacillus sp. 54212 TaxID=3119829 RepID=UPI002FC6C4A5
MGIKCPCGVYVDAAATDQNVQFLSGANTPVNATGDLSYYAKVCVTTLAYSTVKLDFVDTTDAAATTRSFTFTSTSITDVECDRQGPNCVVTVRGTGTVTGCTTVYNFEADFRDQAYGSYDQVSNFTISGFFRQTGAVNVAQGSVKALGCCER